MAVPLPDRAFNLPDFVQDPSLRELYEVIVARMREEAAHLDMGTIQELLIERIAYNYIVARHNEQNGLFEHTTAAKMYQQFWLQMVEVFQRHLSRTDADFRRSILLEVERVIRDTLQDEDPRIAKGIRDNLANAFEAAGL